MKLLDKIKNAIFEEDEFEETEEVETEEKKEEIDDVVKKIDIEKTIPRKIDLPKIEEENQPEPVIDKPLKRENRRTPVIFDEEDFVMDDKTTKPPIQDFPKQEESKKTLYGGYKDDKVKEKFKPSPIISPVYGFVGVSPVLEQPRNDEISSFNEMLAKEKKSKREVTLDTVRQKAFGIETNNDDSDSLGLLYEMDKDEAPAINKITIGDAEEYFEDLGLEYNVDYKDNKKEVQNKSTRSKKNKELTKKVEEEIKSEETLDSTRELEITKEQLKPKTAEEIKKDKKMKEADFETEQSKEEPDEKNLYDLIDMMYENKE